MPLLPSGLPVSEYMIAVYGVLFVGVLLLVEGAAQALLGARSGPEAAINRRLRMIRSGVDREEILKRLRKHSAAARETGGFRPRAWLEGLMARAGVEMSTGRLVALMVGLGCVVAAASVLLADQGLAVSAAVGAAAGLGLPVLWLYRRKRRRVTRFAEQLPEAIDLVVRSLRAGHPLNSGLATVSEELPDPIGTEFGIVVDETTYGMDLQDAVDNLTQRVEHPDLHYLGIAIRIHYGIGGNLAEVLDGLSAVIRSRFRMFRKVRAVTAEGRFSAWFLSLFPIVMAAVLIAIKPTYYAPILESSAGDWVIGITSVLLAVNILVMRWLVNIKV